MSAAVTARAWIHSVDGVRLRPTIETTTGPDGSSAECTDCGAGIENVTHDDLTAWIDQHDGCPAVVGLVQVAATVIRNKAVLGFAESGDVRDWSQLSHGEQADWMDWACGGPRPGQVEHHVFDRSGTVHAEFVGSTGERLCAPGHTNEGRTTEPVDCARCRTLIDRDHIEAIGIKKRAFAAYSRTPLAIRHWSKLTAGEQAAWLTWVAGDKAGPAPVLDTAADFAELRREDAYIDANRGDVAVAELRDALDPPPVVQVPMVPDAVRQAGWLAMVAAAETTVDLAQIYARTLDAVLLPLHQAWVRQAVVAELDQLLGDEDNFTPGGWFRDRALRARRDELAALIEQAGAVTS